MNETIHLACVIVCTLCVVVNFWQLSMNPRQFNVLWIFVGALGLLALFLNPPNDAYYLKFFL
jgi:hypothetical protein